ncbi:Chaperone DnaJ-domain superfamily protein isoform 1 [Hibiscus syriacus]|uniref:Chaperone DnaJ-domain superfamily protein isoform 1 n=1 Tax=Hibiscus syriacus TaxID=106335 RepID=A0A6A2Y088_HIBSY|nr:probable pectin methylesterase CGR2 [Hibiscus syriacus]KAE8676450.1 Chaperone DnaJ-domain superfamily protein isoform 1 [Hibiscus syriacus]
MSRRPVNPSRRYGDAGGGAALFSLSKPRSPPFLSIILTILGVLLIVAYFHSGSGSALKNLVSRVEGDFSCTFEVLRALPVLKKAYGGGIHKVLHVGPDSCSVIANLLKEEETEAWGVEPYDIEDADANCKRLVRNGIVRVADIKFPLPYRPKSFPLVIVSDALDYLSPRYLNKTLPDFARVSADGVVVFTGFPGQRKAKAADVSKYGRAAKLRSSTWWARYFVQTSLEENEAAAKKFSSAAEKSSYTPNCQIFHLRSYR